MPTVYNVTRTRSGVLVLAAAALVIGPPRSADATEARTFASEPDAANALFQAARDGDRRELDAILDGKDGLASCGDESRDRAERQRFVEKYQKMHRLVREPDGTTVLYVGAENWPFPIPLVSSKGRCHFDDEAGRREVTFRRIGADETTAIEVCRAAVEAAGHDDTTTRSDDPIVAYAQRLVSAARTTDGTSDATGEDAAFHGYHFVVRNSGGLTVVAYPDEYRSSGVMTFVVGGDGVVYERDLGPETARVARTLRVRPASGWRVVG
jgi:hypothetical protein